MRQFLESVQKVLRAFAISKTRLQQNWWRNRLKKLDFLVRVRCMSLLLSAKLLCSSLFLQQFSVGTNSGSVSVGCICLRHDDTGPGSGTGRE